MKQNRDVTEIGINIPIQKVQKVQDDKDGQQPAIDLPYELLVHLILPCFVFVGELGVKSLLRSIGAGDHVEFRSIFLQADAVLLTLGVRIAVFVFVAHGYVDLFDQDEEVQGGKYERQRGVRRD